MEFAYILFIIVIIASSLSVMTKKKIEQVIPITVMGVTLFVYIFGLLDKLDLGIVIIVLITLALTIYLIIKIILEVKRKQIKELISNILTPGFIIYMVTCSLFMFINRKAIFTHHDEFSHWGLMIKNMYLNKSFKSGENTVIQFNEYPPFTAVFQYIALKLTGTYSESTVIISSNILYFSMIILIFKNIEWKKNLKMLLIYVPIMLFLPMMFYSDFYKNILVDGLLGIFFFYILYMWYKEEKWIRNVGVILAIASLTLIKLSGIGLSIIAICVMLGDSLINKKKDYKIFIAIISVFLVTIISWKLMIKDSPKEWNLENINYNEVMQTRNDSLNNNIVKNSIWSACVQSIITDKNITLSGIALILSAYLIYIIKRGKDKRYKYFSIALLASIIIYFLSLVITYVYVIPKEEALQIVCFDRYINTIIIGTIMFHVCILLERYSNLKWYKILISICILLFILPTNTIIAKTFFSGNDRLMEMQERKLNMKILEYQDVLKEENKIYYIINKNVGNISKTLKSINYSIIPCRIVNTEGVEVNTENLKNILKREDITHIYISRIDEKLKQRLEEGFKREIKTDTMYLIEKQEGTLIEVNKN